MEVFKSNLMGLWQREDTKAKYRFYENGTGIIYADNQVTFTFQVVTKYRDSQLILNGKRFIFVIMNGGSGYFSIATKSGFIKFNKVVE